MQQNAFRCQDQAMIQTSLEMFKASFIYKMRELFDSLIENGISLT